MLELGCTADRLRSPGFPVEICGVDALHAPFFTERRTRGPVQCYVAGNPGRDDKWRVVTFIRGGSIGWAEGNNRSLHYAALRPG